MARQENDGIVVRENGEGLSVKDPQESSFWCVMIDGYTRTCNDGWYMYIAHYKVVTLSIGQYEQLIKTWIFKTAIDIWDKLNSSRIGILKSNCLVLSAIVESETHGRNDRI